MNLVMKFKDGVTMSRPVNGLSLRDILKLWWNADSNLMDLYRVMRWKYGCND